MKAPQGGKNSELFASFCREMLEGRRIIMASNRGPIEYNNREDGGLEERRGSGGVVTALTALAQYADITWIASAMREGDRRVWERAEGRPVRVPLMGDRSYLRFICTPSKVYYKYYSIFCNPLLWFIQHYMWNSPYAPNIEHKSYDAWENGYVPVNQAFAEAVIAEASERHPTPLVIVHDYHLYLAPGYIRARLPDVTMQHFIHIPWPAPSYWQLLPASMRKAICRSLCACDIVGLQTMRDVRNFLHTCEAFLDDARVDHAKQTVLIEGHLTSVKSYPISIDVASLRDLVSSSWVEDYEERLRPLCGEKTIVRVDRADPSKNLIRGFRAFEMLLERYPDLLGKVKLLAFIVPSRTHIRQYRRYEEEIKRLVESINSRYGTEDWQPVSVLYENNYPQALAGMRLYDVLLVNPVIDGMNLVAKEGPTVNDRDGVLILSETAGAYDQLKEGALPVSPADLEGTVEALRTALTMPPKERKERANILKRSIEEEDVTFWLYRQLTDLVTAEWERFEKSMLKNAQRQPHRRG